MSEDKDKTADQAQLERELTLRQVADVAHGCEALAAQADDARTEIVARVYAEAVEHALAYVKGHLKAWKWQALVAPTVESHGRELHRWTREDF